jgi:hypothetical protein
MREKIYSLDKAGGIRVFYGEVVGVNITTFSGLLDGKHTKRHKTINSGKQKRTAEQQAEFELDSIYNEKFDDGYKTEEELIRYTGVHSTDIEEIFQLGKIYYNTNRHWLPLAMLAEKYEDKKEGLTFPRIAQPKLNGVRCLTLMKDNVIFSSRGGKIYTLPHLVETFAEYYHKISGASGSSLVFDGELYVHGLPLQTISGIARLEKDPKGRKDIIEYHIYDIFDLEQLEVSNEQRDSARGIILYELNKINPKIKIVDSMYVDSHEEVKLKHDEFVRLGYEGAILRHPNAAYQIGWRDEALIKVKEFIDEEFEIVGCEVDPQIGMGSFIFILQNDQTEDTFGARPTGTIEQKEFWYKNIKKYIGKKGTVRYFERSIDNIPTMGTLRYEKSKCLLEAVRDYE